MRIRGKIVVLRLISYAQTAIERRQTCFFLKFNILHKLQLLNVQYNFCSVICYTVLIWTLILLTLENNILLQSLCNENNYVPTDKINASIRIRIRRM